MTEEKARTPFEILFSISRELASTLDLHIVLARVLTLSTENMGAERASLIVLDQNGKPVDAAVFYYGKSAPHTVEQMQDVIASGLAGWVVKNKKPALISNTLTDHRWLVRPEKNGGGGAARSALCVPLMARETLVGVLTIAHPKVDFFTEDLFQLQQAIADLAGIAIRNAQLYRDVQTSQNRYHSLFDESIDLIFITSMDGRIIEGNYQVVKTTGIDQSELPSIQIFDLQTLPPEEMKSKLLEINESLTYETMLKCRNSDKIPVEVHVSPIDIQEVKCLQWIFRDISERKNLESLREDLTAMIYHDLRSPLANITSSMEILRSMLTIDENLAVKQLYEISNRSIDRMHRLINSLLDIDRLEAGQPITNKKIVDIANLVNDSLETIQPNTECKEITIEKMILGEIPGVWMDGDMIRRVLINLLENAVKYSPQGSTIGVGAKWNDGTLTVWVEDHGPGIPPEAKERIFNKFVRLYGEGVAKGLGLGLAFCRLAIQSHGGTIWVENIPKGGSQFIFTLPSERQ
ncbi:MAG: ATP-binding protein [Chloroflexi bacterium]|nr:ATP-binding protein [Chloroflexota bacterium]